MYFFKVFVALIAALILGACHPELPDLMTTGSGDSETSLPCTPDFEPAHTFETHMGTLCQNECLYVFEGQFATNNCMSWQSEVNCVANPSNWTFEVDENSKGKHFKIRATHPSISYMDDLPEGFCARDLWLHPFGDECLDVFLIEDVGAGSQNGDTAVLNIYMSQEYWDCYDSDGWAFHFRFTARQPLPIYQS